MVVSDAPPAALQRTVGGAGRRRLADYCLTSLRRRRVRTAMRASPVTSKK